ncbi:DUF3037 domain-containing protein [Hafnia paralvei]|uniref:DUF3037 domain-containing protein n=1 Tax=Hafnia paralvei TaxID=546367 RepID=UPI0039FBE1D6
MSTPCLYSIIRYAPFAETEEFANIGVVLCAPKRHLFLFKLTKRNDSRICSFFRDDLIFPKAKDAIQRELELVQKSIESFSSAEQVAVFFRNYTAKRESIFQFSTIRVTVPDSPIAEIERIYNKFIKLSEYTPERREEILNKELKNRFKKYSDLKNVFKKEQIGGELIKLTIPLAAKLDNNIVCTIKPLAFDQTEASKMMDHCETWVARLLRASNEGLINKNGILIPVDGPVNPTTKSKNAMNAIEKTIEGHGIKCIRHDAESEIIAFARATLMLDNSDKNPAL